MEPMPSLICLVKTSRRNVGDSVQKERIISSRLLAGQALVIALQMPIVKPKVLIQASAIGYYGFWPENASAPDCTEDSPAGSGFLATTTIQWERSTQQAEHLGLRRCIIRTAPVLGLGGGMLAKLLPVFQLGLGGPVGTGRQPFAWIHLDDEVAAILFLLDHEELSGPFNLVAPEHSTMNDFVQSLGKVLKRPVWLPVPSPLLRLGFGDMADELLLARTKGLSCPSAGAWVCLSPPHPRLGSFRMMRRYAATLSIYQ